MEHLDRTLIISENRKCGEGLPESQQKNTSFSKKDFISLWNEKVETKIVEGTKEEEKTDNNFHK